ncbi:MAG TPA: DUF4249 domain-containing protein [Mucilaginibacter sp.]
MKRIYKVLLIPGALIIHLSCKSPYIPPASSINVNYLHVEGFINTGTDNTTITLSRTVKLTDSAGSKPELNAAVSVVGNDGSNYPLEEEGNGDYFYPDFSFLANSTKQYSLKIVTSDHKTYQSDFVAIKNSPPIDSLNFIANASGIEIYSNTHDPANNTRYYRWDYQETWEQLSAYESFYMAENIPVDTLVLRTQTKQIYYCWSTQNSSTLILNSSAKLSQDVIAQNPIAFIGSLSPKFSIEYSILVFQYALTSDAFNYWQNLKKNTEQLGSIFDALPSQVQGNIHCTSNPSEPVLGYISMGLVTQQRLFIGGSSMPRALGAQIPTPYGGCLLDTLYYDNPKTHVNEVLRLFTGNPIPISGLFSPFIGKNLGYTASTAACTDCRLNGGTNRRPSYWIDKF